MFTHMYESYCLKWLTLFYDASSLLSLIFYNFSVNVTLFSVTFALSKTVIILVGFCWLVKFKTIYIELGLCYIDTVQTWEIKPSPNKLFIENQLINQFDQYHLLPFLHETYFCPTHATTSIINTIKFWEQGQHKWAKHITRAVTLVGIFFIE